MFSSKHASSDQSSTSSSIPPSPSSTKQSITSNSSTLTPQSSDFLNTTNFQSTQESALRPVQSNPSMLPPQNGFATPKAPPPFYRSGSGSLVNASPAGGGGATTLDGSELWGPATLPNQPPHQRGTSKRVGSGTLTRGMNMLQSALLSPSANRQQSASFAPGFPPGHHPNPMNTSTSSHSLGPQPGAADPRNLFAQMPDAEINKYFELMLVRSCSLIHISTFPH